MKVFDEILNSVLARFSGWIQVKDPKSPWTLDNAPIVKDVGVDPEVVKPHCVKCVVVNECWFKNEKGKKPEQFDYTTYSSDLLKKLNGTDGLYHPHCHCQEIPIVEPTEESVRIVVLREKVDDMYRRKCGLITAWGYTVESKEIFKEKLVNSVMQKYLNGDYSIFKYDEFGFRITIIASVPGMNEKEGKIYRFQTGFMVYPNGRIENTTIFGGKVK